MTLSQALEIPFRFLIEEVFFLRKRDFRGFNEKVFRMFQNITELHLETISG